MSAASPRPKTLRSASEREPALAELDLSCEWLLTDGMGGYASSTTSMCPTRRYHGLLVAPFEGTVERYNFLARFDELVTTSDGERYPLSVARYGEVLAPRGDAHLTAFTHEPGLTAEYTFAGTRVQREVRMLPGSHTVLIRYSVLRAVQPIVLELGPLTPFRRADHLTVTNDALDGDVQPLAHGIRLKAYKNLPALSITTSETVPFHVDPTWYRGLNFEADEARGYGGNEDQFRAGFFRATLTQGDELVVAATIDAPIQDLRAAWDQAKPQASKSKDQLGAALESGATDFLQRTQNGRLGIVAGYPWFLEWGRDTFIALPGLTLARGRVDLCAEVLTQVRPFLNKGLLPNIFGTEVSDSHYGSADAALWFARAVLLFQRAGGERQLVRGDLNDALVEIAEAYIDGTDLGLFVDEAGLLHAGSPEHNPTWMDAQTSAGPVTPRHGCPVEIAALWCSLLAHLEELAPSRTKQRVWREAKLRAHTSFLDRLWVKDLDRLADGWLDGERDLALRPNMVLAASLELSPLGRSQRASIVRAAENALVTPVGLRTLSQDHAAYIGRYEGGSEERDGAYHQGTVWPWLVGGYVEASLRAFAPTHKLRSKLQSLVDGMAPELSRAGLGHLSEVFDGDAPHRPGGTIAQAWNTAEWLRARHMLEKGLE